MNNGSKSNSLTVPRGYLAGSAGGRRWVYAIGGDNGGNLLDLVEVYSNDPCAKLEREVASLQDWIDADIALLQDPETLPRQRAEIENKDLPQIVGDSPKRGAQISQLGAEPRVGLALSGAVPHGENVGFALREVAGMGSPDLVGHTTNIARVNCGAKQPRGWEGSFDER
jgi:hypothetical protein